MGGGKLGAARGGGGGLRWSSRKLGGRGGAGAAAAGREGEGKLLRQPLPPPRSRRSPAPPLTPSCAARPLPLCPTAAPPASSHPQVKETRKIWGERDVAITGTCIRVPVMRAHAESINLEFEKDISGGCGVVVVVVGEGS